jgi:hypothetical protein
VKGVKGHMWWLVVILVAGLGCVDIDDTRVVGHVQQVFVAVVIWLLPWCVFRTEHNVMCVIGRVQRLSVLS